MIDKVSFPIFKAGNKNLFTPNSIMFIAWVFALGVSYLWRSQSIGGLSACGAGALTLYYLIVAGSTYEPLNGMLEGEITFDNNKIVVGEKAFDLNNASGFDFRIEDYNGRKRIPSRYDVNPRLSTGVDNYVKFTASDGTNETIFFQLKSIDEWQRLIPFINKLVEIKKMTFKVAINLVGIENVPI